MQARIQSRSSRPRSGSFSRSPRGDSRSSSPSRGSFNSDRPSYGARPSRPSSGGGFRSGPSSFRGASPRNRQKVEQINGALYITKAVKKEDEIYVPKNKFTDFKIPERVLSNILKKGFENPTPIQDQAVPVGLEGRDVIGVASTGTGKTVAFLLPILTKLDLDRKQHKALILAPTRELATQIMDEFKTIAFGMRLYGVSCVGGASIGMQMRELERGVHIVIGTPGRVKDLVERKKIKLEEYHTVVLDEVDRMLDMGFVHDMRYLLDKMPKEKQGLFFSATLSPDIKKLCHDFLNDPVSVSVKTRDTSSSVEQNVIQFKKEEDKIDLLHDVLIKPEFSKVLIFREMKRHVDNLAQELRARGFKALALHGDMRNRERERAVKALATGAAHIVIATDVAARGIDIPDITHVINYDEPSTYDTYIHRIGRTGRGTKTGHALTFVKERSISKERVNHTNKIQRNFRRSR